MVPRHTPETLANLELPAFALLNEAEAPAPGVSPTLPYSVSGLILRIVATIWLGFAIIITFTALPATYTAAVGRYLSMPRPEGEA